MRVAAPEKNDDIEGRVNELHVLLDRELGERCQDMAVEGHDGIRCLRGEGTLACNQRHVAVQEDRGVGGVLAQDIRDGHQESGTVKGGGRGKTLVHVSG